jgi:hypothetical protein
LSFVLFSTYKSRRSVRARGPDCLVVTSDRLERFRLQGFAVPSWRFLSSRTYAAMLQTASAREVSTSAFQSHGRIGLVSRKTLSSLVISVPASGSLLGCVAGTDDSEGLILFQSLSPLPGCLIRLVRNVRSCVWAPMDIAPRLEASFPAYILFCNFLSTLFEADTVALECFCARNRCLRFFASFPFSLSNLVVILPMRPIVRNADLFY